MRYAVLLGSNMYFGPSGVLSYEEDNGRIKQFFRVREIFHERSFGSSHLTIDVDIKDSNGMREVKLGKSKPVASDANIKVSIDRTQTTVNRADGTLIMKVEQLKPNDPTLPYAWPVQMVLQTTPLDAILRITGDFFVGKHHIIATNEKVQIAGSTISGCVKESNGDLFTIWKEGGVSF